MSFPTYVDPIPLPAPVTTGSTIQSYTDPLGDVWVAKNGVNGGNWKRARDVLYGGYYRAAAWNLTTTTAVMLYDTVQYDDYGLYNTSTGAITLPVAGVWRADAMVAGNTGTAGQWVQVRMDATGASSTAYGLQSMGATVVWTIAICWLQKRCAANDTVTILTAASAAMAGRTDGGGNCKMSFAYLGTG